MGPPPFVPMWYNRTIEVIHMFRNKDCMRQLLWLLALTVPWGLGGFVVHTAFSLSAGLTAYWVAGLLVPFIFFLVQKKDGAVSWGQRGERCTCPCGFPL